MTGPVNVIVRDRPDCTVVAPDGMLYFDTVGPLRDALLLLAAAERPRIVLDLASVPICDSSGLNLMVQARQLATRNAGWLRLVGPQPDVRLALDVTNLSRILPVYETVDAAIAG